SRLARRRPCRAQGPRRRLRRSPAGIGPTPRRRRRAVGARARARRADRALERRPRAVASVLRIARLLAAPDAARLQQENRVGRLAMTRVRTKPLYRPVGPAELELIAASGWKAFPPRLPDQPIFYPVLNEQYAAQIAEQWNVPRSGAGYVTEF